MRAGRLHHHHLLLRATLAALFVTAWTGSAWAQRGVLGGIVRDESGQTIKGATVRGQNPDATPGAFTTTTDDKGRFAVIGLRTGQWTIVVEAPGFHGDAVRMNVQGYRDNPSVKFALK